MRRAFHWLLVPEPRCTPAKFTTFGPSFLQSPLSSAALSGTRTASTFTRRPKMNPLNNSQDPVERSSSPYQSPYHIGPKSKILASRSGSKSESKSPQQHKHPFVLQSTVKINSHILTSPPPQIITQHLSEWFPTLSTRQAQFQLRSSLASREITNSCIDCPASRWSPVRFTLEQPILEWS